MHRPFNFVLTKIQFQVLELMSQSLVNVTIILSLARLTSVYQANAENIKKVISNFNWSKAFENTCNTTFTSR